MEYLNKNSFSFLQVWIIDKKLKGDSYEKIASSYKQVFSYLSDNLSRDAIHTCIKRSSLSLPWEKGKIFGNLPVLPACDIEILKDYILENATDGIYIDVEDTIEKVEELRKERFQKARSFLNKVNCYGILTEIEEFFNEHSAGRTWVYEHLEELQAQLFTPRNIQINRLLACTPNKIQSFLLVFIPLVENFLPCLRFAADETMLAPNINRKVLVPDNTSQPLLPDMSDLPHITATCCCSVLGAKMPLFIVLPNLKKLPQELTEFANNGQAYFASSSNGWQTRDTFLFFVICFINWLSLFRKTLEKSIRDKDALLILDGHKSRENPIALKLLKQNKVTVFILPAHTSHLTQIFDVGIASPMKGVFTQLFNDMIKNFQPELNQASQLRRFCVESAIVSYDIKCNIKSCKIAAELTSTYPCNYEKIMNNKFVSELTPQLKIIEEEKERRKRNEPVNINCKVITNEAFLNSLNDYILTSKKHKHLALNNNSGAYEDYIKEVQKNDKNDCRMLSFIPDFYS